MDTSDLQAFLAIAEAGSFSRAAERLFLTQPAVSKRIAALEQELGAQLFHRIGRRIQLTEAGETLLPRARQILLDLADGQRAVRNLSGQVAGRLAFGTSHHIALHRLPVLLRAYHQAHPEVRLEIDFLDSEEACAGVEHGELELALITLPLQMPAKLEALPLWHDKLHVVTAADHCLGPKSSVSLAELSEQAAILPAAGTFTRAIVEEAFNERGLVLNVHHSTHNLETVKMLCSAGLGWAVLPDSMIDETLIRLNITPLDLRRTLGLVVHADRTLSNAAAAMLNMLQNKRGIQPSDTKKTV